MQKFLFSYLLLDDFLGDFDLDLDLDLDLERDEYEDDDDKRLERPFEASKAGPGYSTGTFSWTYLVIFPRYFPGVLFRGPVL